MELINIFALALTLISLIVAVIQTVRVKNIKKIRDSHLQLIWLKSKELSFTLYEEEKKNAFQRECFVRSQRLEDLIVLLIVSLGKIDKRKIDKLSKEKLIDEYDIKLLKRLTRPI